MISEEPEKILADLLQAGVLVEIEGEKLRLGEEYMETRKQLQDQNKLERTDFKKEIERSNINESTFIQTQGEEAKYNILTLQEFLPNRDFEEICIISSSLDWFDDQVPTSGIPNGFIPIRARNIKLFLRYYPISIIYIWQEESQQCRLVKNQLEYLQNSGTINNKIGLGAIYGPDDIQYLYDEFDVGLFPTLLFCAEGRVDSRLIGYHSPKVVQNEVKIISGSEGSE